MYHIIEFTQDFLVELVIVSRDRPTRTLIQQGSRLEVEILPYVIESRHGPIETADLFLADGAIICRVPFASFVFVD